MSASTPPIDIQPVTAERWADLEELFGPSGAYSGCWCMWWRIKGSEFSANGNQGNKAAMKGIVARNEIPGLIGYMEAKPVGWVSLGPREVFGRIERSPLFKRIDEEPVWSIVCFFIHKEHRNEGVGTQLLEGACAYARAQGARVVEAYPIDTKGKMKSQDSIFTGTQAMFERAGFQVVQRAKPARPMMRRPVVGRP